MKVLVTGGAGFIGSALVRLLIGQGHLVVNIDALTYAACLENLAAVETSPLYRFVRIDIRDRRALDRVLAAEVPDWVVHLAAESHVDRSIAGPAAFVETNISGTFTLLEAARAHWQARDRPEGFRFVQVSTDEVFGSLPAEGRFGEASPYAPRSPYAASKAAADHLARVWHETYGLPVIVTNCSNNYGPFQFPEKLIPLVILRALQGGDIPVYGDGMQVRDWLHVDDHATALLRVLEAGQPGRSYNIGAAGEMRNIDLVQRLCALVDEMRPVVPMSPRDARRRHVSRLTIRKAGVTLPSGAMTSGDTASAALAEPGAGSAGAAIVSDGKVAAFPGAETTGMPEVPTLEVAALEVAAPEAGAPASGAYGAAQGGAAQGGAAQGGAAIRPVTVPAAGFRSRRMAGAVEEWARGAANPAPLGAASRIVHVTDRPGHDQRYAIDAARIGSELGWQPHVTLDQGLRETVRWYLDNPTWWQSLADRDGLNRRLGRAAG